MNDGKGEFSLCEIFAEAFVVGVGGGAEVEVIVADLEEEADGGDEGDESCGHDRGRGGGGRVGGGRRRE